MSIWFLTWIPASTGCTVQQFLSSSMKQLQVNGTISLPDWRRQLCSTIRSTLRLLPPMLIGQIDAPKYMAHDLCRFAGSAIWTVRFFSQRDALNSKLRSSRLYNAWVNDRVDLWRVFLSLQEFLIRAIGTVCFCHLWWYHWSYPGVMFAAVHNLFASSILGDWFTARQTGLMANFSNHISFTELKAQALSAALTGNRTLTERLCNFEFRQ